jgi:serine phosphatase RsbU (regulator of sigma subunit)/Tfp pilus assembly protein PilF
LVSIAQLSADQQAQVDSLQQVIKTAKHDTIIVNAWIAWDNIVWRSDPEMDFVLNQKIDSLCAKNLKKKLNKQEKAKFLKSSSFALNSFGIIYNSQGESAKAIEYYTQSLKIQEEIGYKSGIAASLNNIGIIYKSQGDYAKAIEYYTQSLKIEEEIGYKSGIASSLNNIGTIYDLQGNYAKAMDYYTQSLKTREEIGDKKGIASSLNNIGTIHDLQGNDAKAMDYYTQSLKIREEIGDKKGIASSLNNIGIIYHDQGESAKAIDYYIQSLKIEEEFGDKKGIAKCLNNIGIIYNSQGNYAKAFEYSQQALTIAQEIGAALETKQAASSLWKINKKLGCYKESLAMYELFIATRDSMESEANQKAVIQQEYKYAYEKQAAADSVKAAEAVKVTDALLTAEKAENKQHQQQQYFLYAGLALALLFGAVIFNRFKIANKQKDIIEQQKQKVDEAYAGLEEAHKEITDSINYAERIQRSFLATDELLNENLNEYFVYFNPKEAVSGDFYWAGKLSNGNFAMVNADSTGHGVPGAIMSILNVSSIEKAIEKNAVDPADIFNQTRKSIIEQLKKDGSKDGGKDGMDASLISFNSDKTKMSYVAAQNPIWIIRDSELTEIKPEKMPIGKHNMDHLPFKGGEFDIQKGDQIYTLTDGYPDQFGGPKGKKFMVKKMRDYVLSISHLPMQEQYKKLNEAFSDWKGEVEQVDDVCVIGIKI